MNPYKLREIYKYLTRAKKADPSLPDVFSASKAPIPAKTKDVEEIEAINRFMRNNPRVEKAGGGMLVQPSVDGSRPGYAEPVGNRYGQFTSESMNNISDAILKAYADDDISLLFEKNKQNPTGLISSKDSKQGIFSKIREDPSRIDFIVKNTGLDEETIFDILDDRTAYLELEKGSSSQKTRFKDRIKFFNKAEKWLTTNAKRYSDPVKFEKAFTRTFGKDNLITKTIKANITEARGKGRLTGFSDDFINTILSVREGTTKADDAFNSRQLKDMFKTVIYNNNPNVRKKITTIFENIIPELGSKRTPDIRNLFANNATLKKFGLDKSIKGPIARLIANEINEDLLTNVKNFQKPFLGTDALLSFLKDRVDPKYKEMFREASNAVKQAQKNQWPQAKKTLNLSQSIMFDHKIPKSIIDLGYADEIEYIKLNPTSEKFNATIKRSQFDTPMNQLIKKFEQTKTLDGKAAVVKEMNKLKNNFSKKYGGYLDEVTITPDKTGKPIFKSSAVPVTKKTDFVSSLGESMVQTGEISKKDQANLLKKMGFKCKFAGSNGGLGSCDDPASYLDDINKTRSELNSSDVAVRAAAKTKLNKGLQVAKTLPTIGKFLRRVGQATVGGVSKALQATGLGTPVGLAIEGMVEGGIYDYYRGQGYTHDQAYQETFFPGIITGREEGVPWYGGAESMLEKELVGDPQQNPKVLQYQKALEDQEQVYDAFDRKQLGLQKQRKDITDVASADIQDLNRSGTISNINRIMNPESMASRAYQTAVENQIGAQDQRARDYKSENYVQKKPSEFMENQLQKDRNEAMLQMFPPPTVDTIRDAYTQYGIEDRLKNFTAQDYKDEMKRFDDYQKQSYFADNFRLEKAGGGIAKLAGVSSGVAPVRGPNPQGLPGLLKRGIKI